MLVIVATAVGVAGIIAVWNQPALLRVGTLISLLREDPATKLPVPVEQVASTDLEDTWGAPRSDNRRHEGIDIFAPLGRPVTSTTDGVVFKVGENSLGGHVVRVLGPGWQWHYYAHLDRFADIKPGSIVQRGSVLGYVGNTGNAVGTPYHLHYGVYRFMGGAQNPYPLLAPDKSEAKNIREAPRKKAKAVRTARATQAKKKSATTQAKKKIAPAKKSERKQHNTGNRVAVTSR